ncbi:T9SS type A sorting domain-containing protein [Wenyingzhuangia aestuarii]|uniref:T9SS type A sorting domain-containing protein n=1 Tax=Wenyingzhuangia aestuarii TaxID=1647582 RepID=UPI001439EB06|nr:T9SS type A sorting domain-containing protein [Wenyingzhuangia aestuarii]NJB83144.1 hypothetical protein [Wenyingzhuangia aestuarii]
MKKITLLALTIIPVFTMSSQIAGFNTDAYGFELTNVQWTSGGTHNGASSPGNIVDAITQNDGFIQSDEKARTGTYSLLADFSSSIPGETPSLQGWRANVNGETNYDYIASATTKNYTLSAYIYINATTDGNLRITSQGSNGRQYNQLSIPLNTVPTDTWTKFSISFDQNVPQEDYWSSVNFSTLPTGNVKIFVDDISIVETSTLSANRLDKDIFNLAVNYNTSKLNITAPKGSKLEIFNVLGSKIKTIDITEKNNIIDISTLSKNMYICKLNYQGNTITKKIIAN